jgi:lysophospholipase L1-like esterase
MIKAEHDMGPARLIRRFWQSIFFGLTLWCAIWLARNLLMGNYFNQLSYFVPVTGFLFLCLGVAYLFAFRLQNVTFVNLNLSLAVLGVLVLGSEIGIRIWDQFDPIFRPAHLEDDFPYARNAYSPYRAGGIGFTHGQAVRINAWGFRGAEWPATKPANAFRILVVGDSMTFGQGIGEDKLYTTLVEKGLRAKFPGMTIEVLNVGVMGYSAVDEMKLLESIGPLLHPDLVLVGFTGNDVREGDQVPERERNRWAFPIPEGVKTVLISNSKLVSWLTIKYDQLVMNAGLRPNVFTSLEAAYDPSSDEWKVFVAAYRRMLEWTQAQRIPPPLVGLFLTTPYPDPRMNDFIDMTPAIRVQDRFTRQVEGALNGMGIPTVDYVPLFQRHNQQNMMVSKWEGHPNAQAHQLYAEGFLDAIMSRNLVQ